MSRFTRPVQARTAVVIGVVGALVVPTVLTAGSAGALKPTHSQLVVAMRGNGHGHGMSQYGAEGAAIAGRSYQQIVAFYYPGTRLKTLKASSIRVKLGRTGSVTQVGASRNLHVTGVSGALPSVGSGVARYRLASNNGKGLRLQRLTSAKGATWTTIRASLPDEAQFHRTGPSTRMRIYTTDGLSRWYYGSLRAVRESASGYGGGVYTVNQVSLDAYTAGVVPREMPASWGRQATDAQAVAARTYGRYAVEHPQSASYDICDTTSCQVYGGAAELDRQGRPMVTDFPRAARDTANKVLTYQGSTIFAQFSASNGGWTVYGGQPYLPAKADPYDNARSGDPYLHYTTKVSVASLASYFGLTKITEISITQRDGHGAGGGRATRVTITGQARNGRTTKVSTTGQDLAWAIGAGTTWIGLSNT